MQESFIKIEAGICVTKYYHFQSIDYTSQASLLEAAKASKEMNSLLSELNRFLKNLDDSIDKKQLVVGVVENIFDYMIEVRCWEGERTGPRKFGYLFFLIVDLAVCNN